MKYIVKIKNQATLIINHFSYRLDIPPNILINIFITYPPLILHATAPGLELPANPQNIDLKRFIF